MTTVSEIIRSRATQISEIRRTGSRDLASVLLRDLFLIAEGIEVSKPAHLIAKMLSDSPTANVPAPTPDVSVYPFRATFRGQGEMLGQIVELDDRYQFPVTAAEAQDAAGPEGLADAVEFDALAEAAMAPAEVKGWTGPFEITLERRLYRVEQKGQNDIYADTIPEVQDLIRTRLEDDARSMGGTNIPLPAIRTTEDLSEAELVRQQGTIVIGGPAYDIRVVQQEQDLSAQDHPNAVL